MREDPSKEEPSSTQSEQLELVGGPFCGVILKGSTGCFELGCAISTPCIRDNTPPHQDIPCGKWSDLLD